MIDSRHSPHFHFQEDLNPPYLSTMSHANYSTQLPVDLVLELELFTSSSEFEER